MLYHFIMNTSTFYDVRKADKLTSLYFCMFLQVLEPAMAKPFELLLDLTQFSQQNEIPNQWLNQLFQLLPYDINDNLLVIYVYNANSNIKKYSKKMSRPLTHRLGRRMIFAVQLAELHEHILPADVKLPQSTGMFLHGLHGSLGKQRKMIIADVYIVIRDTFAFVTVTDATC